MLGAPSLCCSFCPPSLHAQVYERTAVLEWIRMRNTVPHSPGDRAYAAQLRPCYPMQQLVRQFHEEFDAAPAEPAEAAGEQQGDDAQLARL